MDENGEKSSAENESSFERSVYTEFFQVVVKNGKNVKVLCTLCPPASKKTFSTALNSTANLKKHLKVFVDLLLCSVALLYGGLTNIRS